MMNKQKKNVRTVLCGIFSLLGAIILQSCFYEPNQPFFRKTGELVDAEKSGYYYHGYGLFKKNIYYHTNTMLGSTPQKLRNADKKTFTVLGANYAKDKNRAYHRYVGDVNVDVQTFEYVVDSDNWLISFLRDKNHVYRHDSYPDENEVFDVVPDADRDTYQVLGYGWSKDDKNVYYKYKRKNADPQTFTNINRYYSKDKNNLFVVIIMGSSNFPEHIITEKCNTDELVLVTENYIHTNNRLYYYCYFGDRNFRKIQLKDPASIEVLEHKKLKVDGRIVSDGICPENPLALELIDAGMSIKRIMELTGLTEDQINDLVARKSNSDL
jgi:hypothetical protein